MNKQNKMIEKIKWEIVNKICEHNMKFDTKKELIKFEWENLGNIKAISFETNYINGNCFTTVKGLLFVGKRGGLKGEVWIFGHTSKIKSKGQFYKINMFI